jgi:hypothetical protein
VSHRHSWQLVHGLLARVAAARVVTVRRLLSWCYIPSLHDCLGRLMAAIEGTGEEQGTHRYRSAPSGRAISVPLTRLSGVSQGHSREVRAAGRAAYRVKRGSFPS